MRYQLTHGLYHARNSINSGPQNPLSMQKKQKQEQKIHTSARLHSSMKEGLLLVVS